MSGHSLNSPSSFARRIGCPGSANMERDLPNETSVYAAEGTAAHALGELCLLDGSNPKDHEGTTITNDDGSKFEVCGDMVSAVTEYVDYCRALAGDHLIEHKFSLKFLGDDEKGTSDFTAVKDGILHVVDYKHGRGVSVEAENNVQGLCYALGAAEHFKDADWSVVRITIVQPRAYHEKGGIRSWDVTRAEMIEYAMDFAYYARLTEEEDAPLDVGDWCMFCKAKPRCPAQMEFAQKVLDMDFKEPTSKPVPVEFLSDETVLDIVFNKVKIIEKWCSSMKDYAQKRAEAKEPIKGSKLVATRSVSMWGDKDAAEKLLSNEYGDRIYEKKFMSAPKVKKLLGKKEFEKLEHMVDKVSTGVTLVPESDPRKSVRQSAGDEFGDIT